MSDGYKGKDKREFFRYNYEGPIHYKVVNANKDKSSVSRLIDAVSKNLSASGILFTTTSIPEISSVLVLDLDYRTTRICQEIENRALVLNDKLIGKVVRIEDNEDGRYNIGVAFVKKTDSLPSDITDLIER